MFFMGLVGRADLPSNNAAEFIAYARSRPGKMTYASQGVGQFGHLMMEALKLKSKIDILHVPYRGAAPAINDILAGQVDVFAGTLASTISQINAGKVKLLAPTGHNRLAAFPDLPALPEVVPGLEANFLGRDCSAPRYAQGHYWQTSGCGYQGGAHARTESALR